MAVPAAGLAAFTASVDALKTISQEFAKVLTTYQQEKQYTKRVALECKKVVRLAEIDLKQVKLQAKALKGYLKNREQERKTFEKSISKAYKEVGALSRFLHKIPANDILSSQEIIKSVFEQQLRILEIAKSLQGPPASRLEHQSMRLLQ